MDTKKLRQKILDLAIHGKLVPQDPNDEPASVLLERIRAEKERLIKEGKIKRSKKSSSDTPHYEKVPFEVQESWEWSNVESFTYDLQYGTSEKSSNEGDVPVLRMGNISRIGTIDFTDLVYSSNKDDIIKYALLKDDLLFNRTNSSEWVGKTAIFKSDSPAIYAGYLIRVRCILVCPDYINFVLNSSYHREWCNSIKTDAVNQSNINAQKLSKHLIPIPPYEEQLRIVAETKKWMSVIDKMEGDVSELDQVINTIKSKILDLAIHGKLVPQDPNDEPAIELLKRINPKYTPCDNAHYENVPSNWAVCKVKDIFRINPKTKADDGIDAGFVPMSNIHDSFNNSISFEPRAWGSIKKGYTHFEDGDIVVAKISPCLENRKSAVIVGLPNGIGAGTTELNVFRSDYVYPLYGLFFFKSDYFISQCVGTFNGVVGQQRVSTKTIEDMVFPVPPRPEQERIINKVNELFQILDDISAEL